MPHSPNNNPDKDDEPPHYELLGVGLSSPVETLACRMSQLHPAGHRQNVSWSQQLVLSVGCF